MSDIPITITGPAPPPVAYTLAPTERWTPTSASATFDGTGAAGDFLPCCSIYSQTGVLLGRMFPGTMHPGDVAEVTYSPFSRPAATVAPPGGGIQFDTDNQGGWLDVTTNNADPGGLGFHLKDNSTGILIESTGNNVSVEANGFLSLRGDIGGFDLIGPLASISQSLNILTIQLTQAPPAFPVSELVVRAADNTRAFRIQDSTGAGGEVDVTFDALHIGFFGALATTRRVVTGSRGGNAALASLLTGLAQLGLITNSTTP